MSRQRRRYLKQLQRRWRLDRRLKWSAIIIVILLIGALIDKNTMHANYNQLLSTIANGESRGNYNAHYGNPDNASLVFTHMSVAEVLDWQQKYVQQGSPSSAVGKYQLIEPTLRGLVEELRIDHQAQFDQQLQDRLAVQLLKRRGVQSYLRGRITREEFAHNLSKEWAALPRVVGDQPEASYYAGDGLNRSQVSVATILAAIDSLHQPEKT